MSHYKISRSSTQSNSWETLIAGPGDTEFGVQVFLMRRAWKISRTSLWKPSVCLCEEKKYWETTGEKTRIRLNPKKINCKNDLIYCNLSPRKGNKAELGKKLGQVVWWKILTQTFNGFFFGT